MLVGVDLVDITRIEQVIKRTPRFLERVFSPGELEYCMAKANPYPSLAVRFAAREALRKVHPAFIKGIAFHDVEVCKNKDGQPELFLHEPARCKMEEAGIEKLSLSLSHSNDQAIAVVVATERVRR